MSPSTASNDWYFARSAGQSVPSLGFAQSFWALLQRRISVDEAVAQAYDEGYRYFEAGLAADRVEDVRSILRQTPVELIAQGWAARAEEAEAFVHRAADLGAIAINMHLGHAFLSADESIALMEAVQSMADRHGLPLLTETHRGRMTQDLYRTVPLLQRSNAAGLVLDVSHYLVAGEGEGNDAAQFQQHIEPVLAKTAMIHGRVSSGQQVQVEPRSSLALTELTCDLWQRAMTHWLKDAPADAVFIFEPELGPPPYASLAQNGEETFDRTLASAELKKLAEAAWTRAQAASKEQA